MKTALIIEDHPDSMVLISRLLEKWGYRTIGAGTGRKGIELALQNRADFIILDIQLPDMDGTEVLRSIRAVLGHGTPVIAMTSYAMSGDRERLLAAGCDGYIEKPIDPELVLSQIRGVIGEEHEDTDR
ncbi:MAG TPA: response regulator [Geobacter sp.]|nr:response regulator [Geobacter sp.]